MEVLNELVFAIDNQPAYTHTTENPNDDAGGNGDIQETTTCELHHDGHKESEHSHATESLSKDDLSRKERLPCVQDETNFQHSGSPAQESGLNAVLQVPEGGKESRDPSQEGRQAKANRGNDEAGHETTHNTIVMDQQQHEMPQTIVTRTRPGQGGHRRASKFGQTQPISTSQHNRFRGHVRRGRGRMGTLQRARWSFQAATCRQQGARVTADPKHESWTD